MKRPRLKIALLGTRGVPAAYGGFETFAEHLSTGLVERGHDVTVYGRRRFGKVRTDEVVLNGVRSRFTPTVMSKYFETPVHALTSFVDVLFRDYDVALLCNAANAPFSLLRHLCGLPVAINVDGIERHRSKWNALGKGWYLLGEALSVVFASRVISDAEVIKRYYSRSYGCESRVLSYGASASHTGQKETLEKFGLKPKQFVLYVSRFEPENNPLGVVQAYRKVSSKLPLVMVGDAPYAQEYIRQVHAAADSRVIFTGFQFGESYRTLRSNCALYIQATEVGGTHPALIEGMAFGNAIIANGTPENVEVLGGTGEYYRKNDFDHLARQIERLLGNQNLRDSLGAAARERATERYSWERVVSQYEELFYELSDVK